MTSRASAAYPGYRRLLRRGNHTTQQQKIGDTLTARRRTNALCQRYAVTQGAGRWLQADGRQYLNFSSNDYLGLSHHPQITCAWQQGAERFGVGSGGLGHVGGHPVAHQALEEDLAQQLGYPRALLFTSGFAANQTATAALMGEDDRIVADRPNHASLLETASPSPAVLHRFAHNDSQHPNHLPITLCPRQQSVVTEGVFSVDGDSVPPVEIHAVTRQQGTWLLMDDMHGIGVSGEEGRGSYSRQQMRPELLIVTSDEGSDVSGAAILCSDSATDCLLQFARHLIYNTSMLPAQVQILCAVLAVTHSREGDKRREKLAMLIQRFRAGVNTTDLTPAHPDNVIRLLIVGDNHRAL